MKTYLKLAMLAMILIAPAGVYAADLVGGLIDNYQEAQREPQRILDPLEFFDKTTGKIKVWYWRAESGYEFYDAPGFHPRTGQALASVTLDVITEWQQFVKLFTLFKKVFELVRADYVDKPDEKKLLMAAIDSMQKVFPSAQRTSIAGKPSGSSATTGNAAPKIELDDVYNVAMQILNENKSESYDLRLLKTALEGMVGSLDLHSSYIDSKSFRESVARARAEVKPVRSRLEGDDVGFIQVTQFNESTTVDLKKAITDLSFQGGEKLKGFIIDLRNNPGGLLDQAMSVSDLFLEKGGEILSTRGRNAEKTQRFNARSDDLTEGKPIVVLINRGSAAAAEIVAAALQDHKRATLIGTRSFGRGSVQTIIPLGSGNGALRLTTARFLRPSGRPIEGVGVTPNFEVLQDEEQPRADENNQEGKSPIPADPKNDKVLRAAVDLLHGIWPR